MRKIEYLKNVYKSLNWEVQYINKNVTLLQKYIFLIDKKPAWLLITKEKISQKINTFVVKEDLTQPEKHKEADISKMEIGKNYLISWKKSRRRLEAYNQWYLKDENEQSIFLGYKVLKKGKAEVPKSDWRWDMPTNFRNYL